MEIEGKCFLVVDDEEFIRYAVERLLRKGKAEVVRAIDGVSAIKALIAAAADQRKIDAVVTDLNMLPVNGLELLNALRVGFLGIPRTMPAIMFTALQGFDPTGSAMALDVNAFISKPVSRENLHAALEHARDDPPEFRQASEYRKIPTPGSSDLDDIVRRLGLEGAVVPEMDTPPAEQEAATDEEDGEAEEEEVKTEEELAIGPVSTGRILSRDYKAADGQIVLGRETKLSKNMINRLGDLRRIDLDLPELLWVKVELPE